MIVAFSGHRPDRLKKNENGFELRLMEYLKTHDIEKAITGMADGFDLLAAVFCIELHIPYIAAIPYKKHANKGGIYAAVYRQASEVVYIRDEYHIASFNERNKWMVDHADIIVAAFDGKTNGGTWDLMRYAKKMNKEVINVW